MPRRKRSRGRKEARHLKIHAQRRAHQRYDIWLSDNDFTLIRQMIENNQAEFVERQSCNRTAWRVTLHDVTFVAIYDKKRKMIATVLPQEAYKDYQVVNTSGIKCVKCSAVEDLWTCTCGSEYCDNCIITHWQDRHLSEPPPDNLPHLATTEENSENKHEENVAAKA